MVWWGSENKHHKDTWCLEEIGLSIQVLLNTPHSINGEHNCEDYVFNIEISKRDLPITITYLGRSDFPYDFCWFFIADLLMQHKFHCVNLIGRSWRTRISSGATPTYLIYEAWLIRCEIDQSIGNRVWGYRWLPGRCCESCSSYIWWPHICLSWGIALSKPRRMCPLLSSPTFDILITRTRHIHQYKIIMHYIFVVSPLLLLLLFLLSLKSSRLGTNRDSTGR